LTVFIGRAKGLWVFFDIKRRRPVQIFDEIKERWSSHGEMSLDHDIVQKIETLNAAQYMKEFSVHRFDIDMNRHVNNIKYLQWVMESIPDEIMDNYYLHTIDGRFITEAQYGDKVRSFTETDGDPYSFVHNIKVETNDRVCAAAKTVWKKR
jgi:medium-chain acyl-[acyl-carrier-protein] hydrolase